MDINSLEDSQPQILDGAQLMVCGIYDKRLRLWSIGEYLGPKIMHLGLSLRFK